MYLRNESYIWGLMTALDMNNGKVHAEVNDRE